VPTTAIKYDRPRMNSTCSATTSGSASAVQCRSLPKSTTTIRSAPTPKNLSIMEAMVFVNGNISIGKITFCTKPELLLTAFIPLFMASENARKGSRPQYR
jgi:hypothetical protein